jgi:hypothetical protein
LYSLNRHSGRSWSRYSHDRISLLLRFPKVMPLYTAPALAPQNCLLRKILMEHLYRCTYNILYSNGKFNCRHDNAGHNSHTAHVPNQYNINLQSFRALISDLFKLKRSQMCTKKKLTSSNLPLPRPLSVSQTCIAASLLGVTAPIWKKNLSAARLLLQYIQKTEFSVRLTVQCEHEYVHEKITILR